MAEVVARVVRTPRGAYAPDPSFGVDYAAVEKAAPAQRPAALRAAVTAALQRWTSRRLLTALAIEVDPPAAGRLVFRVVFRDPRSSDPGLSRVAGSL
jgi:phage baseplate assembly protein W